MQDFKTLVRVIVGGVSTFEFVKSEGISIIPEMEPIPKLMVQLKPGYQWQKGWGSHDSITFEENLVEGEQGTSFNQSLKGFLPDDQYSIGSNFRQSRHKFFIVRFKDHQGQFRLLGTPDDPARFDFKLSYGNLPGPKGYEFSFSVNAPSSAKYIQIPEIEFYINDDGNLIQERGNTEDFSINGDGELVVVGPDEANYSINTDGQLIKA
ncbi:MAG: hypothetical protein LPK80_09140 [Bacteroidota bacterium]|nr:hypothetical protein [Bacteroidota bacterium]